MCWCKKTPRLDDLQRVEVHLALGSGDRKSKNMLGKIEPHHIQDFEHVNLGSKFPVYEHGSGHFKIMILILDRKGNRGRRIVSSWPAWTTQKDLDLTKPTQPKPNQTKKSKTSKQKPRGPIPRSPVKSQVWCYMLIVSWLGGEDRRIHGVPWPNSLA